MSTSVVFLGKYSRLVRKWQYVTYKMHLEFFFLIPILTTLEIQRTKISHISRSSTFHLLSGLQIFDFEQNFRFLYKIFNFSPKFWILNKIFDFWAKFLILNKIFDFWTKFSIFEQNFRFLNSSFDFWTKFSIFKQNFRFFQKACPKK